MGAPRTPKSLWMLSRWEGACRGGGGQGGQNHRKEAVHLARGLPPSAINQIKALPLQLVFQGHQSPATQINQGVWRQASASHTSGA